MVRVEIESPFAGDVRRNVKYARRAMADSLKRGEAPIASHLLYTQPGILDDTNPGERKQGMDAGKAWSLYAEKVVLYADYGVSGGMAWGKKQAEMRGIPVEVRYIGENSPPDGPEDAEEDVVQLLRRLHGKRQDWVW